jgi:glycosyltransferase involved in cell wall biosynthesis
MPPPLVSVIIPTHNRSAYLRLAADSVLGQSIADLELLIVDDCSTDDTDSVIRQLAADDERVCALRTSSNSGCNLARNRALDHARGRYVAFLDDDDIALPHRLNASIGALESHPWAAVASGRYRFIDASGAERPGAPPAAELGSSGANSGQWFERLYRDWAWFPTRTLTCRASVFERFRYPPIRRPDGDSILLCQMAACGLSVVPISDVVTLMRRDRAYEHMSRDRERLMAARRNTLVLLQTWLREQGISDFDHLHSRAWSNHLLKEAELLGGLKGLLRGVGAVAKDPRNREAGAYVRSRLLRRIRKS